MKEIKQLSLSYFFCSLAIEERAERNGLMYWKERDNRHH